QVYHNLDQSKLPAIKLFHSVENTLSSDENEALTLSVMVFRLWGLYCKSISDKKVTEEIIGCSPNILDKGVVKSEHKKVLDANVGEHIFIFITDAHACDDESYDCNEIVITSENRKDFYGDILAKMKLYCIG
ncbi:3130_t:CDS:2, partial [Entrophospora sp. SA101]